MNSSNTGKGLAATVWIFGAVGSIGYGAQMGSFWMVLLLLGFFAGLGALIWILDRRRPHTAGAEAEPERAEEKLPLEPEAQDLVEEAEDEEDEELIHPISAKIFVKPSGDFVTCPHCGQRQAKGGSRCFACGKEL